LFAVAQLQRIHTERSETMTQSFDFTLTQAEIARILEFKSKLKDDKKEYFDSDDFRNYHLDKYMTDKIHEVGAIFAKLKYHAFACPVGETPSTIESNNRRKVDLWCWIGTRFEDWYARRNQNNLCVCVGGNE
jgi:hypothetical protein